MTFLELRPLSNERSGNFTFYRGIHEFLNSFIKKKRVFFEENDGFWAIVAISQNFLWNSNHSIEYFKTVFCNNKGI